VRELRSDFNPVVAPRRERSLLVQRLRALLQDERHQSTSRQAQEAPVFNEERGHLVHKLCDHDDNVVEEKHERGTSLQRLWTLPQTAQCVEAHGSEEREHPDEKPEVVDKVKEETFRDRRLLSSRDRRSILRVRSWDGGDGRDERAPVDQPDGQLLPGPPQHGRLPVHELVLHVRCSNPPQPTSQPLPPLSWHSLTVLVGSESRVAKNYKQIHPQNLDFLVELSWF